MRAIWNEKLEPYVIIMRCRAEHALHLFMSDRIDILHFDQNHSEFSSMRDIQIYYPLVKPGGYIWFDDTDWTTTAKAISWLSERASSVRDVGTCRLFRKHELVQEVIPIPTQHPGAVQNGAAQAHLDPVAEERAIGNGDDGHSAPASVESNDAGDEERIPSRTKAPPGRNSRNRSRRTSIPDRGVHDGAQ